MSRYKLNCLTLVLIASSWVPVAHAEGAGTSIPVQINHSVSLNALTRTYQVCAAALDKDVARQAVKMTPAEFDATYRDQDTEVGTPQWSFRQSSGFFEARFQHDSHHGYFPEQTNSFVGFSLGDIYRFSTGDGNSSGEPSGYAYLPTLSLNPNGSKNTQFSSVNLPYMTFSNTLNQAKYDELGNLDQSTVILAGLSLVIPADYQDQKTLVNAQSSLPSSLTLDFKGFVDCLQSEIRK